MDVVPILQLVKNEEGRTMRERSVPLRVMSFGNNRIIMLPAALDMLK
ncbi:MAG: hypothetical protein ACQEWE_04345 [Bacillota bacterium]